MDIPKRHSSVSSYGVERHGRNLNPQASHDGVLLNKHTAFPSFDRVRVCQAKWILELPKALTTPQLPVLENVLMMSSKSDVIVRQELRRHI